VFALLERVPGFGILAWWVSLKQSKGGIWVSGYRKGKKTLF